jgi:hypothetical protein
MLQTGFTRASLTGYTGFKSSPYTEGALFYGEKLVDRSAEEAVSAQTPQLEEPKTLECPPGRN